LLLVALVASLAGGCGIDADPEPRALPVTTTTTSTPTTEPPGDQETEIYMVKNNALVPITRRLPASTTREVMNSLLVPPTGGEGQGLSSSIPASTRLLEITGPDDGLLEIDLSSDFEDVQAEARVLALGQIVMSQTLLPDVQRIKFSVEGEPLSIFSPEQGDVKVVDACDYSKNLANPEADDVSVTIQQALALTRRRDALDSTC
jgi:hypothetical protein